MNTVFADTSYFLALGSPDDVAHRQALAYASDERLFLVTTAWVLTEFANAISRRHQRERFGALLDMLEAGTNAEIVPATQLDFDAGSALFRQRPDKDWSLTDCISFVVMKRRRIAQALTGDRHFKQAGFKPLLA
ncbi:MAG: type II toxin-antitoxin system VapC family toxin [Planctomycetes bacterium]|nr:type II toxin-antitoxin system VapC family toxin [Planctomycetota bacterium]